MADLNVVDIDGYIENNVVGTLTIQYGTPTLSLSSSNMQIIGRDENKLQLIFNLDDFEILQGVK